MVLVLRTCNADGSSTNNFQWNLEIGGVTSASDWDSDPKCGKGLHGFLNGEGDGNLAGLQDDSRIWMVVEPVGEIVDLEGKVKFESAVTKFVGARISATNYLRKEQRGHFAIIGGVFLVGDSETVEAGYKGQVMAGDACSATTGDFGSAIAGKDSTAFSGWKGFSKVGDRGAAKAEDYGTAIGGCESEAEVGQGGTAKVGDKGIAKSGSDSTSISGARGVSIAASYGRAITGSGGQAAAGYMGSISINYWDGKRHRTVIGYVGEEGILADTLYALDENHKFCLAASLPSAIDDQN